MTGVYIFGGIIIIGAATFIFYKVRWGRASKKEAKRRSDNIEADRIDEEAKRKEKSEKVD